MTIESTDDATTVITTSSTTDQTSGSESESESENTDSSGCMSDDDCSDPAPVCDLESNTCVFCSDDSGCEGETLCLDQTQCVACIDDSNCPCIDNECVGCKSAEDCVGNSSGEVCNSANECVICTVDNDSACFGDNHQYCDTSGADNICGQPESCSDLRDWGYISDGEYWLTFFGGTPTTFDCALAPDGSYADFGTGWTKVRWDQVWGSATTSEHLARLTAVDIGTPGVTEMGLSASHDDYNATDSSFSYYYTLSLPNYNEFFFDKYEVNIFQCFPGNCTLNSTGQTKWTDFAHSNTGGGTLIFGSEAELALNIVEKTDFQDQPYDADYPGNTKLILDSVANPQADQLGVTTVQDATTFRIAWGERGIDQIERIDAWSSGAIWFRRNP